VTEHGGSPSTDVADLPAASPRDRDLVRELLGREPAGRFDVVVRDESGGPVVIRNHPLLDDGTPMPTRYWLVGRDEVTAVSRLEAGGGVRAAEAAVDADELAAAHARYAAERDADVPRDAPLRPSGGVAGTRQGVKCLHAHYAWHLAGGDDPVGRWVAAQLGAALADDTLALTVSADRVALTSGTWSGALDASPRSLAAGELSEHDPPSAVGLTNALGEVSDLLDDHVREQPALIDAKRLTVGGDEAWHLALVEQGRDDIAEPVAIDRDDLEDLFRTLATERRADRIHNPALRDDRVDLIVATCCTVLAIMRRLQFGVATFVPSPVGPVAPVAVPRVAGAT
jgi:hypothetical protein